MQRIVKWSPKETNDLGWDSPNRDRHWLASDLDEGHVESFTLTSENLRNVPDLAEALTHEGRLGVIREMNHEVRQRQRVFIFLVDFDEGAAE